MREGDESELFERLKALFEEGHARDVSGLISDAQFATGDAQTPAAVLVAVTDRPVLKQRSDRTEKNSQPGIILTQRPNSMRDHPGQVAFPGGKIDAGEDAVIAALREAEEELDLPRDAVRVIGTSDLYTTGTGFEVTPVLGVIPPDLDLTPNPAEVEAWFEAPLSLLLDRSNWTQREALWRGETRRYLEMDYSGYRIWGVTAAIIANLSRRIDWT